MTLGDYKGPKHLKDPITDPEELDRLMGMNNPKGKPVGPNHGRCSRCGSSELWVDKEVYVCNCCGHDFPVPKGLMPSTRRSETAPLKVF